MTDFKNLQRQIAELSAGIGMLAGDHQPVMFGDFAREYVRQKLLRPLRSSTLKSFHHQVMTHLIPAFGSKAMSRITNADWLNWVAEKRRDAVFQKPGHGRVTRFFNARKYLAEILIAAKSEGHIERVPKFDSVDEPKNVGRVLEDKEIHAILRHSSRPFRFIFYSFWKTGCRPREVLQWEWSMIRWKESGGAWVDIPARISKTGVSRSLPLNAELSRHLKRRFDRGNGSPFVFPHHSDLKRPQLSYHGAWKTACTRAGVKRAMPYDFRRTFITRCAAQGLQMLYVAKILGTSLKMIEGTYAKSQVEVMESIVNAGRAA